jgi:hypothetical protein
MTSIAQSAREFKDRLQDAGSTGELLRDADIVAACRAAGHRWRARFWTPTVTMLTFLRQVMHGNCACREAVALTLAKSAACGEGVDRSGAAAPGDIGDAGMSGDPSAYSQARQNLPRQVLEHLNRRVVDRALMPASSERLWCGRRVQVVDGSSVSMPDTADLQAAFPQPVGQKPGCGFPVVRLVALFCWASGGLLELVADSLHVGELTLFRRIYDRLAHGTVVLGDRYYGSYYDLAMLRQRGLDGVFRMNQRRPTDFRRGRRLGKRDHVIVWHKPKIKPKGIAPNDWATVPETLVVRHVRVVVGTAGCRSACIDIVTTLLDPVAVPVVALAGLYRDRWTVELNLRSLKTTLGMEVLRCKSVDMVRKELLMYSLAYNLVRLLMWQAAALHGVDAQRLSVAGTQQRLNAMLPYLEICHSQHQRHCLAMRLLGLIAADIVPNRPNRIEPRAVKRRPKNYRRLTCPRSQARKMTYFING